MSTSLMTTRRFAPLFWCQFFSAFNDNFLKNALVFLILFKIEGEGAEALITLAAGSSSPRSSFSPASAVRSLTASIRRWWRSA